MTTIFRVLCTFFVSIWAIGLYSATARALPPPAVTEAPTGFDGKTNGVVDQATFEALQKTFEETAGTDDGLGPVYNARSCGECTRLR